MKQDLLIGTFLIGAQEFGLDVKNIEEVVNSPEVVAALPLSHPCVEGVFNLRGQVIPVVNLKRLLKLASSDSAADKETSKIAIVTHGTSKVGFVFEKTGEMLRVNLDEPHSSATEPGALISGVVALDEGRRMIEILNAPALLESQDLPKLASNGAQGAMKSRHADRQQCITFQVQQMEMGLEIASILEVVRLGALNQLVLVSNHCMGLMNLRGENLPIVHFARFLGLTEGQVPPPETGKVIILRAGGHKVGLLVNEVTGIEGFAAGDVLNLPTSGKKSSVPFSGMLSRGSAKETILIDAQALMQNEDLAKIGRGYANITKQSQSEASQKASFKRQHFLLFKLGGALALPMHDLQEIIELPHEVMTPPGLPESVRGLYNLRGEVITLVDLRRVYRMEKQEVSTARVLVFKHVSTKYGLIVDSVESIVAVDEQSKIAIPHILRADTREELSKDIKDFMEINQLGTDQKLNLIVMDFKNLFKRLEAA